MKMDSPQTLAPAADSYHGAAAPASSTEVFLQLGALTRLLHDTLEQLGVMPKLQTATDGIPDARSRLTYIATKTAAAADKVLTSVDAAKAEHELIASETRALAQSLQADPVKALASGSVLNFVTLVEGSTAKIDSHLTDIMMAQDFHDLTGQVVAKVVTLANDLEDALVKLLVSVVPPEQAHKVQQVMAPQPALQGPVVDPNARTDTVANQGEVDDLLASLGF
jgi:chemotaxis protein CheZ